MTWLTILAQTPAGTGTGPPDDGGSNALVSLMPLLLLVALFWFVMIRPQRRMRQQHTELLKAIELGDEVETIGGIYGTVRRMADDVLWIDLAPGTTIKVSRAAVRRKVVPPADGESASE